MKLTTDQHFSPKELPEAKEIDYQRLLEAFKAEKSARVEAEARALADRQAREETVKKNHSTVVVRNFLTFKHSN